MNTTTTKAGRREWIGLAVLALPTLLLSLDVSVLYLALPQLSTGLGADANQQLWIMDIYSFMLAGFLTTMGTLGDRIGRRRLLLIGGAAFGVASIAAAYAPTPELLIVARALLGVAGATLMPSTMALIRNMFHDPKQMGAAIGVWFTCFLGGMALGPLVGGVLLEHFWWGSAFLLGVPFMVALLILGPALLPEFRDSSAGRLDLASVALSLVTILPVIYGLKTLARDGWQPAAATAIAVGVIMGVLFVRRQNRLTHPHIDLRLFRNRVFSVTLSTMLLGGIVMAGISLMSTLYLQTVVGLSPLHAGLWLIPQYIAMIICVMSGPALATRIRPAYVMALGLLMGAAGFAELTQIGAASGPGAQAVGLILASGGIALPMGLGTGIVMQAAPPEKAGSAASLSETGGEFGVAMGVATLGTLGAVVYRSQLADLMHGAVPAGAQESVTAAFATAAHLPGSAAATLLDAARTAFTSGLNVVAAVGVLVFAGLTVSTAIVLRQIKPTGAPAPAEEPVPTAAGSRA
ncbi:MFS transporter [Streptosporangiaceae bacterium NEAU-GS5]|nr:MFS transporter [Streptosporangiaceae bacterium NEAU-GS5]